MMVICDFIYNRSQTERIGSKEFFPVNYSCHSQAKTTPLNNTSSDSPIDPFICFIIFYQLARPCRELVAARLLVEISAIDRELNHVLFGKVSIFEG